MAAPSYTTDLTTLDAADATTNWTAIGTGAISAETDYYVENGTCISKVGWTAATRGMIANSGSDRTSLFTNNAAYIAWVEYHNPPLLDTYANGGIQLIIGNSTSAYRQWYVSGSAQIPLGAWHAFACDPINVTADTSTGSPTTTRQYFGALAKVLSSGSLKGNPFGVDVIRIGREARCEYGDLANGYATIAGLEAYANSSASGRRWGLIMNREGAYYIQGDLVLGTASNAVDFRDSDVVLFIMDTPKCASGFNEIEVRNSSSRVDWTRFTVKALGTTSPGKFTVTNDCDINFSACSFIDLGTFSLGASTDMLSCVFIRCSTITAPGSNLTGSTFTTPSVAANASTIYWNANVNTDGKLDSTTFSKGTNAHHAIEIGTSGPTTFTLREITFSGFNASDGQNDSVLYLRDRGSDTTWNISAVSCSGTVSYKKERSGDTVNLTLDSKTLTVQVKDAVTGSGINGAMVLVTTDTGGPYFYQASVSITRSGSTATVSHSSHGLVTNDKVVIEGCNEGEYNGLFTVTKIDSNSYSYTVSGTPATPATGTPTSTFVIVSGTTSSGEITSAGRAYSSTQPYKGRVRKATSAPIYKTAPLSGSISALTQTVVVQMISDD